MIGHEVQLFCGYDEREAIGWHVFVASVMARTSRPVSIRRLDACGMPKGSNEFTYSRFLVPWLMGFTGHAIFADSSDMLMLADIAELDALFDDKYAVQVVRHPNYTTRHKMKYVGTSMQCPNVDYARKNWASIMLMNCAYPYWRTLDPEALKKVAGLSLLQFGGLRITDGPGGASEIGALPPEWNVLADEGQPIDRAKVLHWTAGLPCFEQYRNAPGADAWRAERDRMLEIA